MGAGVGPEIAAVARGGGAPPGLTTPVGGKGPAGVPPGPTGVATKEG